VRIRITRRLVPCLLVALLACALSTNALAKTRHHHAGAGTGGTTAETNIGQPVPTPVGSTTGTITFTPASVVFGQTTVATGALVSSDAGQPVSLELEVKPGIWDSVATATVGAGGAFAITWKASVVGIYTMRVVSGALASATASVSTPEAPLTIMRSVIATWYGPGFYGNKTACGETLTRHILGVANRTLPCGTPVTLFYNRETLTVPVIDRGPYANNATFDLTYATAQALGVLETVNVGYTDQLGKKITPTNWYPAGSTGPSGVTGTTSTTGPTGSSSSASGGSEAGGAEAP
jgi:rare lipoprotein A